ncbi:hypothetical protein ACN27E_18430 [Mycobacterium sp. WMMD1722]|uniref:hypothetical protein n=1 Tax=Mycobacterium sp. WMMD1722 TaxID=3404117 RepID=UPI003BF4F895
MAAGRRAIRAGCAGAVVAVASGCGWLGIGGGGMSDPLTPEQARAQVVDVARELVRTVELPVSDAYFWFASCNDQGEAPFRGQMRIGYPAAATFEESDAQIARMAQRLLGAGWTPDPEFRSHGTVLARHGVAVVLRPQNVSTPGRNIELFGECRDVTTTGATLPEPVALP